MAITDITYKLTVSPSEAADGTKKVLRRKGKRLEVTIPAGVRTGTLVKLSGALQITDDHYGDIFIQIKVKSQHRIIFATAILACLFVIAAIYLAVISYSTDNSYTSSEPEFVSRYVYEEDGAKNVGGDGEPIVLLNNPNSTNPTFEQLLSFIRRDTTDSNRYIEIGSGAYVCSDFAEDVHNNAEAAGIRAAWVGIDFYSGGAGHAINAFETTDRGLVYIDCVEGDALVYIEIGEEYIAIDITYAESLSYTSYVTYCSQPNSCGCYEPMGVVSDVYIHW